MHPELLLLTGFGVLILVVLFIDLLVVGRKSHVVSSREAIMWTIVWVSLAFGFYFFLNSYGYLLHGIENKEDLLVVVKKYNPELIFRSADFAGMLKEYCNAMSINYISGYFIEETLSIDNIFVILMILQGFSVPLRNYKTVLFWGILGAIILRFIFIFAGAALINRFEWILIVFGIFLIFQGGKIIFQKDKGPKDPHHHPIVKFVTRHINVTRDYVDNKFILRENGKLFITPLVIVLILIEFSDLIFAFDSIPAVFAVTRDPYIVFFSNIFAIIGLRSLFFLIANLVNKFRFLKYGVSSLLLFVGFKLVFHSWLEDIGFQPQYSLFIIAGTLLLSILLSIVFPRKEFSNH